jgi:hypothetical protein
MKRENARRDDEIAEIKETLKQHGTILTKQQQMLERLECPGYEGERSQPNCLWDPRRYPVPECSF